MPPLSLQPLVENAVYHGIEPSDQGGSLEIHGQLHKTRIMLTVRNTLPERSAKPQRQGNRQALENLRLRLEGCFPEEGHAWSGWVQRGASFAVLNSGLGWFFSRPLALS